MTARASFTFIRETQPTTPEVYYYIINLPDLNRIQFGIYPFCLSVVVLVCSDYNSAERSKTTYSRYQHLTIVLQCCCYRFIGTISIINNVDVEPCFVCLSRSVALMIVLMMTVNELKR